MAPKSWAHICESRVLFHVCALYGYLVRFGFGHVSPKPRNIWHVRSCSCSYSAIGYSKYSLVSKNLWRQRRITRAGSAPLRGRTANQSLRAWSSASAAGVMRPDRACELDRSYSSSGNRRGLFLCGLRHIQQKPAAVLSRSKAL